MELAGLSGFRVWRTVVLSVNEECSTCPKKFDAIANIDYLNLPSEQKKQQVLTLWDDDDKKEGRYDYAVSAYTVQGRESERSNEVTARRVSPPSAPGCLTATSGD